MSDLIQFREDGFQSEAGVDWISGSAHIVPASNRRRILDRDKGHGHEDGWTYQRRPLEDGGTAVTRIRWEDTRLYDEHTLAGLLRTWTRIECQEASHVDQ